MRRYRKGDLVKQRETGGHVMTVIEVSSDGLGVIASYQTPDGKTHEESWSVDKLKRVDI